jgi:mRNA-degrading endonuclease RelE of RelBE toxin-antitoxin system
MSSQAYQVEFTPTAERQLAKLPGADQARIAAAIDSLETDPARQVQKS